MEREQPVAAEQRARVERAAGRGRQPEGRGRVAGGEAHHGAPGPAGATRVRSRGAAAATMTSDVASSATLATPFASSTPKLSWARICAAALPKLLHAILTSVQNVITSTNAIGASAKA